MALGGSAIEHRAWHLPARQGRQEHGAPVAVLAGLVAAFMARLAGFEAALLVLGGVLVGFGFFVGLTHWLRGGAANGASSKAADVAAGATFVGFACALLGT